MEIPDLPVIYVRRESTFCPVEPNNVHLELRLPDEVDLCFADVLLSVLTWLHFLVIRENLET